MHDFFWIDSSRSLKVDYKTFYKYLIEEGDNNVYIQDHNPYAVFLKLLRNSLCEKKSIILDADFSQEELARLEIIDDDIEKNVFRQTDLSIKYNSLEAVLEFFRRKDLELEIEIYTSGTTGIPKKISQTFANIVRAVKASPLMQNKTWGFAYNPTHFAGLQVFFQAFFNRNTLVYVFDIDYRRVYEDLLVNKVTHLSCTPTYMKMLLPIIDKPIITIESLTFGGEKFDPKIETKIKEKFPNAAIKNVYASTEAGSLLRAEGEYFVIPNRYKEFVKIVENELLIHKMLLGKSKVFDLEEGKWYKTGDIVEFLDEKRFKFKNRKSEMINVGGYKVNPTEVEEVIKRIEGIIDVIVFGRKNAIMGNIIAAHVIKHKNIDAKELKVTIRNITASELQEFKTPRIIKFVDSFELTRTGKIKKQ